MWPDNTPHSHKQCWDIGEILLLGNLPTINFLVPLWHCQVLDYSPPLSPPLSHTHRMCFHSLPFNSVLPDPVVLCLSHPWYTNHKALVQHPGRRKLISQAAEPCLELLKGWSCLRHSLTLAKAHLFCEFNDRTEWQKACVSWNFVKMLCKNRRGKMCEKKGNFASAFGATLFCKLEGAPSTPDPWFLSGLYTPSSFLWGLVKCHLFIWPGFSPHCYY